MCRRSPNDSSSTGATPVSTVVVPRCTARTNATITQGFGAPGVGCHMKWQVYASNVPASVRGYIYDSFSLTIVESYYYRSPPPPPGGRDGKKKATTDPRRKTPQQAWDQCHLPPAHLLCPSRGSARSPQNSRTYLARARRLSHPRGEHQQQLNQSFDY